LRKFQFRLESLLSYRVKLREQAEARLSALLAERERLMADLQNLRCEREQNLRALSQSESADATDLRAFASYHLGWRGRLTNLSRVLDQNQREVDDQRRAVMVARQSEKALSNLREKRLQGWKSDLEKTLQSDSEEAWLCLWNSRDTEFLN
jgi:flagellar export protein FliJ